MAKKILDQSNLRISVGIVDRKGGLALSFGFSKDLSLMCRCMRLEAMV